MTKVQNLIQETMVIPTEGAETQETAAELRRAVARRAH
jgi:hypothetical protein